MISYELAKELEDAGFPQDILHYNGNSLEKKIASMDARCRSYHRNNPIYFPDLSELIAACRERFYGLHSEKNHPIFFDKAWIAMDVGNVQRPHEKIHEGVGATPEEAVARLWIALNKKK